MAITLKKLPEFERPYEKLELYGEKALSDSELLAIILETGTKEETAIELAYRVLSLGIKTTKIQDIRTQNIISIANRNIEQIEILPNVIYINIPLPYELKVQDAENAVNEIVNEIQKEDKILSCSYKGVNNLGESSIDYLIAIECDVNKKLQIRRDALRTILVVLEKHNISVPYNQIDVHNK